MTAQTETMNFKLQLFINFPSIWFNKLKFIRHKKSLVFMYTIYFTAPWNTWLWMDASLTPSPSHALQDIAESLKKITFR